MSACLDENQLAAFFGQPSDDDASEEIDRHVAQCEACRVLVATYVKLFDETVTRPATGDRTEEEASRASTSRERGGDLALPNAATLARLWADRQLGRSVAGKWRLERVVGIGGSAVVFEGVHKNGSRVALKILRIEHVHHVPLATRFLREERR